MIPLFLAQGSLGTTSTATVQITITIPERTKEAEDDSGQPILESENGDTEYTTEKVKTLESGVEVFVIYPE